MARYIIAYVCAGVDKREPAWVLGAVANDDAGFAVAANPNLDLRGAADGTDLSEATLRNWAASMRYVIQEIGQRVYDPASKDYVPVPPTDPTFLSLVAADAVKEWNYYYSRVSEAPGTAAEVAAQMASGS